MSKNLKKRILTSITLFIILFSMFINNYVLGYFILVTGILSIIDFTKMIKTIFNNFRLKQLIINLFFITYIFSFCFIFFIFSTFFHLKIILFLLIIVCIASDIGGFIFGKIIKGPKLTKISPNKTISGSIGSLVFSSLITIIFFYYATKNINLEILIIGLTTSISCQTGDLFFSLLKRKSLFKDSGNYLPGHGGILDRIDGILFGVPVGFLTLLIIY